MVFSNAVFLFIFLPVVLLGYMTGGIAHVYTLFVVIIGWVMFRASGLTYAFDYIRSLFGLNNPEVSVYNVWLYLDRWTLPIMILGIIMSTPILKRLYEVIKSKVHENILIPIKYSVLLAALFLCILQVASNTYSAFISSFKGYLR